MKYISICGLSILLLISCTKEEPTVDAPVLPSNEGLDLNSDGVIDFEILYSSFVIDGTGFTRYGYSGKLKPLDENQFLIMEDSNATDIIIPKTPGDTLSEAPTSSEKWLKRSIEIIRITSQTESIWPDRWQIHAPFSSSNPNYIGIRINQPNDAIGWMLIETSESTGKISLIESKISFSESIVINPG